MTPPDSILILRFSSLGDVPLTTPLVRVLRYTFPKAHIGYVTKPMYASLVRHNPHIDETIEVAGEGMGAVWQLARSLRGRFEAVVDLHTSMRSFALRRMLGARTVHVWPRDRLRRQLLISAHVNRYTHPVVPVPERFFAAVSDWEVRPDGRGLDLVVPPEATTYLKGLELAERPFPVIAPSARWETKRWSAEHFVVVARRLAFEWNAPVALVGGAEDARLCEELARNIGPDAVNLAGRTNLLETAAVIARASVFVGNDTGLMHMAAALGTPLVAVFGCTVEEFGYYPYRLRARSEVVAVDDLACRPCTKNGRDACPQSHFRCMTDITPDQVLAAAVRVAPTRRA